ncbi:MAG: HlyC/CorC family transporter [Alphaproteobacteria bacterium]
MDSDTLVAVGSIFLLLILSGLFSGSETALTAASQPRMHLLRKEGDQRALMVTQLFADKEKMIGTILLGNNLTNILASALATSVLIAIFGDAGVVYATGAMTMLVLVFGEVLPKTYAFHNADRVALAVAPTFRHVVTVLTPVTMTINAFIRLTLRLFRIDFEAGHEYAAAHEALRGAIDMHRGEAPTVRQERNMLRSILELAEVDVFDVMQHRQDLVAIDSDLPTSQIIEQIVASPYTRIPLWRGEQDNIIGMLHVKELLRIVNQHRGDLDSIDIDQYASPPWFVPESTSLIDQLQAFRRRREHFALVVDEYGSLMGLVTLEDIIEEIVGDIVDEHDVAPVGVRPQSDGSYLVDGRVTIRDLNRRFDWRLAEDDAATIAGFVIEIARIIPDQGQIFSHKGFRFEIVDRHRNRIALIRISPPAPTRHVEN